MHELSIACNLVDIAETAARSVNAVRVDVVHLKLGVFSGVIKEALFFAYDTATEGTLLAGSRLEIEDVPLVVYCPTCGQERELPSVQLFQCPQCGAPATEIRSGREIELSSMEIVADETEIA